MSGWQGMRFGRGTRRAPGTASDEIPIRPQGVKIDDPMTPGERYAADLLARPLPKRPPGVRSSVPPAPKVDL